MNRHLRNWRLNLSDRQIFLLVNVRAKLRTQNNFHLPLDLLL